MVALAQHTPTQDCRQQPTFTSATAFTGFPNNTTSTNCRVFALSWTATSGVTALSIQLEGSDDQITWTAYTGTSTVVVGTNPSTALSGAMVVVISEHLAFVRANVTAFTGTGTINAQLYGVLGASASIGNSTGGGACTLAGDVTGACGTNTVVKVNGGTIPLSASVTGTNASRQIIAAALTNGSFWLGNGSNLPIALALSGDCTMTNLAVITCTQINGGTIPVSAPVLASNSSRQIIAGATSGTGSTVLLQGSPTITTPTIADFTNANHTHANTAGGGQLDNTAVKAANQAGVGAKFAMANALGTSGNCANWNANGVGDSGSPCGSGGSGGGGVVTYSGPTLSILSGTSFCPIGGGGACSATETNVDIDSSATATVSKMFVQLSTALGAGNSVAVTWRANASSQTVTCTISGAVATSCNDTTHSFTATTADLLDYQLVFTGTILVTPTITVMSAFGTSNVGVTGVIGTAPINVTAGTTPVVSCPTCSTAAPAYTTVSFSATPTFTVGAATNPQNFQITLTGNVTSSTLTTTSATTGQDVAFKICQDGTGSRTFAPPANLINFGSIPTTASTCGKQIFRYDGANAVAFSPMVSDGATPGINTPTGFLTLPTGSGTLATTGTAGAMVLISDQTVSTPGATVTFSSIPGTFKHLQLYVTAASSSASGQTTDLQGVFNTDTTSGHYALGIMILSGTTVSGAQNGSTGFAYMGTLANANDPANFPGTSIVNILNYAGTTFLKTALTQNAAMNNASFSSGNMTVFTSNGTWNSTAAITQIDLHPAAGNFTTGSRFTLYGIN